MLTLSLVHFTFAEALDGPIGEKKCPVKNDKDLGLEFIVCFAAKVAKLVTSFMGK